MPVATNAGVELRYERAGSGEPVVLVPTLGYGPWQWGWQFQAIAGPFEAIATVLRGTEPSPNAAESRSGGSSGQSDASTGQSDASDDQSTAPEGPYDVATLAADVEAVLADAGARRAHVVGFGLGGHVALEYAHRFDRSRSLALLGTTPGRPEGELPDGLVDRLYAPRDDPDALAASLDPVLSEEFRASHPDVVEGVAEWRAEEDASRAGWAAQAPAFEEWQRSWPLYEVTEPTLVCHGTADAVAPPANAATLGDELPNATVERYDGAGHLVTVERSRPLNDRLVGFLEAHASDD